MNNKANSRYQESIRKQEGQIYSSSLEPRQKSIEISGKNISKIKKGNLNDSIDELISDMVMPNHNNSHIEISITENAPINSDYNNKKSNTKIPYKEYSNIRAANILNK